MYVVRGRTGRLIYANVSSGWRSLKTCRQKTPLTHKRSLKECCHPFHSTRKKGRRTVQVDIVAKSLKKDKAASNHCAYTEATHRCLKMFIISCSTYFLSPWREVVKGGFNKNTVIGCLQLQFCGTCLSSSAHYMVGSLPKWRAERGGAMFINLVLESLMVTSVKRCAQAQACDQCLCVERWGGVWELRSNMNIIYGTQNDNLPARQELGALSMYSYLFSARSCRWCRKNTWHPL